MLLLRLRYILESKMAFYKQGNISIRLFPTALQSANDPVTGGGCLLSGGTGWLAAIYDADDDCLWRNPNLSLSMNFNISSVGLLVKLGDNSKSWLVFGL